MTYLAELTRTRERTPPEAPRAPATVRRPTLTRRAVAEPVERASEARPR